MNAQQAIDFIEEYSTSTLLDYENSVGTAVEEETEEINITLRFEDNEEEIQVKPEDDVIETLTKYGSKFEFGGEEIEEGTFEDNGVEDGAIISITGDNEKLKTDTKFTTGEFYIFRTEQRIGRTGHAGCNRPDHTRPITKGDTINIIKITKGGNMTFIMNPNTPQEKLYKNKKINCEAGRRDVATGMKDKVEDHSDYIYGRWYNTENEGKAELLMAEWLIHTDDYDCWSDKNLEIDLEEAREALAEQKELIKSMDLDHKDQYELYKDYILDVYYPTVDLKDKIDWGAEGDMKHHNEPLRDGYFMYL